MEKIDILGVPYTISRVPYISREELTVGQIDYLGQEIKILDDLEDALYHVTLLHEIFHAILNQLGFSEEESNEHLVQSLATALYQVLTRNQLFV